MLRRAITALITGARRSAPAGGGEESTPPAAQTAGPSQDAADAEPAGLDPGDDAPPADARDGCSNDHDVHAGNVPAPDRPPPRRRLRDTPRATVRLGMAASAIILAVLAVPTAWAVIDLRHDHRAEQRRALFVQMARQGAVDLTTIDVGSVDADVHRILAGSVGRFHDEFQERSPAFIDLVKQVQSKSAGAVTAAGLESENADEARVMVALNVTTSAAGVQSQPRAWRMRVTVQEVAPSQMKMSDVEFVP